MHRYEKSKSKVIVCELKVIFHQTIVFFYLLVLLFNQFHRYNCELTEEKLELMTKLKTFSSLAIKVNTFNAIL